MTQILQCVPQCHHKYQDEKYGQNMRVFNKTTQNDGKLYRCSVCGSTKGVNLSAEEAKKLSKKK